MLEFLRDRNAREYAVTAANGIDEARYVQVGGIEQWITIQPGGRTARNRMVFRKFGMKVASAEETIRRVD